MLHATLKVVDTSNIAIMMRQVSLLNAVNKTIRKHNAVYLSLPRSTSDMTDVDRTRICLTELGSAATLQHQSGHPVQDNNYL